MSEDKYDNYTDDDFLADLNAYADQRDAEQAEDNAELKQHLGEMVGGFLGVWWYLRAFGATSSRNIRTYAAVADKQAKLTAWETADDQINQEHPHYQSKVTIMNEFGACSKCLPYLGNDYTLAEAKSLVPFHYNCRCTIVRDTSDFDYVIAGTAAGLLTRKGNDQPDSNPITDRELQDASEWFTSTGGLIITDDESVRMLDYFGIEASAHDGYAISLRPNPNRAAVYEELHHAKQYRDGIITDAGESRLKAEIMTQHYLLDNAKMLKLSDYEIMVTRKALNDWGADLNEFYNKNGISNRWQYGH